jgi:hypothetical protein
MVPCSSRNNIRITCEQVADNSVQVYRVGDQSSRYVTLLLYSSNTSRALPTSSLLVLEDLLSTIPAPLQATKLTRL